MRKVVVAVTGGLGNQLFQLAAGIAVGEALRAVVSTNCRMYDVPLRKKIWHALRGLVITGNPGGARAFELGAAMRKVEFDSIVAGLRESQHERDLPRLDGARLRRWMRNREADTSPFCVLRTPEEALEACEYPDRTKPGAPILVLGFHQDDRLVERALPTLRRMLRPAPTSDHYRRWAKVLDDGAWVGVHVRRGDYRNPGNTASFAELTPDWYARAADAIRSRAGTDVRFAVFTDDPEWADRNLRLGGETRRVSGTGGADPALEMRLLAACRHHIIANSTFSWWGARLAATGGEVVAPRTWTKTAPTSASLCPPGWTLLTNAAEAR
jgi:hypothetical protein